MTRAQVEDEPPAKKRRGDREAIVVPSSPLTPPPLRSSSVWVPPSSPLSPPPLFEFGTGTPHEFRFENKGNIDKGKGRAIVSPSPKVVKRKPVPALDEPLSKKRKHEEDSDEDGPRPLQKRKHEDSGEDGPGPFQRRVIDFDRQPTTSVGTGTSSTQTSSTTQTSSVGVNISPVQTSSIGTNTLSQSSSVGTSIIDISDDETVAPGESSYINYGEDDGEDETVAPGESSYINYGEDDGEDETVAPGESSYINYGEDEDASDNLTKLEARVDQQAEELALFRLTVNPPLGAHTLFLDFHAELRRLLQARSRAEATKAIEIEAVAKLRGTIDLIWWGLKSNGPMLQRPGMLQRLGMPQRPGMSQPVAPAMARRFWTWSQPSSLTMITIL
ncbi:hypothetical protein FFLO_05005 [Filobasidium floriforme]|uniref:Uncharacterized protein n=1 Tax=Filobasidium floriforme TaxID=5210 RepID=A0A8K0JID4_9TREE|nr:hypothetical protein FFLO_05005 [Filobasidium floriforme]